MRNALIVLVVLGLCSSEAASTKLDAISLIETGNRDWVIGSAGEVSRYQIKPIVWRQYSASRAYTDVQLSTRVAAEHLSYLETVFRSKAGREPSDFDRYVMWNAGFNYYARKRFSPRAVQSIVRERATRYANLCQKNSRPAGTQKALLAMAGHGTPKPQM